MDVGPIWEEIRGGGAAGSDQHVGTTFEDRAREVLFGHEVVRVTHGGRLLGRADVSFDLGQALAENRHRFPTRLDERDHQPAFTSDHEGDSVQGLSKEGTLAQQRHILLGPIGPHDLADQRPEAKTFASGQHDGPAVCGSLRGPGRAIWAH
jgi:hypothetical protein